MNSNNLMNRDLVKQKIEVIYQFLKDIKKIKKNQSTAEISSRIEIQKLFSEYKAMIINDILNAHALYEILYDDFIFVIDHYPDKKKIIEILGMTRAGLSKYYTKKGNMSFKRLIEIMIKLVNELSYLE